MAMLAVVRVSRLAVPWSVVLHQPIRSNATAQLLALQPLGGVSDRYFRSNCTLAIWIWSGDNGDFTHDFSQELQVVRGCNGVTPVPSQCVHWTHGIAGTGGTAITSVQVGAVNRFVAVNWVGGPAGSNFNWYTNPPTGIAVLPPV